MQQQQGGRSRRRLRSKRESVEGIYAVGEERGVVIFGHCILLCIWDKRLDLGLQKVGLGLEKAKCYSIVRKRNIRCIISRDVPTFLFASFPGDMVYVSVSYCCCDFPWKPIQDAPSPLGFSYPRLDVLVKLFTGIRNNF